MNIEKVIITRIYRFIEKGHRGRRASGDRDGPYIFTKFHGVDNFVESQPLADPNGEITGITLKFVAAGEIF